MKFSESLTTLAQEVIFGNLTLSSGSVTAAHTATFPDKDITVAGLDDVLIKRVIEIESSATPAFDFDNCDIFRITALAENISYFNFDGTQSPTHGQRIFIEITGTASRTITWGNLFESSTVALPLTTVGTNMLMVEFAWNSTTGKLRCIGVA
jgi:hypothetical protein